MPNKKTIMYCPLNDGHIVSEIQKFSQQTFEKRVQGFRAQYGIVSLQGTNDFQRLICKLPAIRIQPSDILLFDKVVADYDNKKKLDDFWEKNEMQLQKPTIKKSTSSNIYLAVAALMQLKASWDKKHYAKKQEYSINAAESHNHKEQNIRGYHLSKVGIALRNDVEVSASIDLDHDVSIRISDLTLFGSKKFNILDEKDLYQLVTTSTVEYDHEGKLLAPCIEEKFIVTDHLRKMGWASKDALYKVNVESSEALTKLKLNEKGVEARAETYASARMLVGCSKHDIRRFYQLTIKHGLVIDIRYRNQTIFVAYVPQERFIKA